MTTIKVNETKKRCMGHMGSICTRCSIVGLDLKNVVWDEENQIPHAIDCKHARPHMKSIEWILENGQKQNKS